MDTSKMWEGFENDRMYEDMHKRLTNKQSSLNGLK